MQNFDEQHPRVRLIFGLVAVLIVIGGLWLASSFIWPEDNGHIEILKADNTPFKTRPDDKGGMQIPHQDKLIFNTVTAEGKPVTVERIMPGPEQPLNAPAPVVQQNADPIKPLPTVINEPAPQPVQVAKQEEKAPEKLEEKSSPLPKSATIDAPSAATPDVAAMGRVVEAVPAKPTNQPVKPPAAFDMSKGDAAIIKKPEPSPEKPVVEKQVIETPKDEPAPLTNNDVFTKDDAEPQDDAEPLDAPKETPKKSPEGKARFQIASFFDRASAEKGIAQFKSKYADELDGAGLTIATATINGNKQVFRVQGSASSAAVASSICSGIKSKGGSCVTIK